MKAIALTIALVPMIGVSQGQTPLSTDRPGFSDGSSLVAPRTIQLETGIFRTMVQRSSTNSFGDLMIRYGIDDRFELRIFGVSYGTAPGGVEGWLDPSVGCKLRLYKRGGELTFVGQTTVPIGANPLRANEWNPTGKLAWSAPAGANTVGGNVVFSRMGSGSSRFTQSAASVYYSLPLTSKIALTNEFWVVDQVSKGGSGGSYASVAGTYLVNLDTQLDLRVGSSFNQRRDGWFIQAGISYRF